MDFKVYPGSRIERLPVLVRVPALAARNLREATKRSGLLNRLFGFDYFSDGLATSHYSPFKDDLGFERAYQEIIQWWWQGREVDVRWRMWIMAECARQCAQLPGDFAEFGVYRGGCAYMILDQAIVRPDQKFYLFDTFAGIPDTNLTAGESTADFGGRWSDTSVEHVMTILSPWKERAVIVKGDVFDTLPVSETGPLAFCHMDLNASAPTLAALEYVYRRMLPASIMVMDDYAYVGYEDQRESIDRFFSEKPESPIALPTGQGIVFKI